MTTPDGEFLWQNYRTITEQFVSPRSFATPDFSNNSKPLRNNPFGVGLLDISAIVSFKRQNIINRGSRNADLAKAAEAETGSIREQPQMPKRQNGRTAKRETRHGRNGRDNHPNNII